MLFVLLYLLLLHSSCPRELRSRALLRYLNLQEQEANKWIKHVQAACFLDTGLKSARLRRLIDTSVVRIERNQFSNDVPLCVFITEYLICIYSSTRHCLNVYFRI